MTVKISLSAALAACFFVTPLFSAPQYGSSDVTKAKTSMATCERLLGNLRRDPSLDTWRNRMKVWPCYRKSAYKQADLVLAAGGVVR
jgi:hypothetical protein